jgi:CTP synthase (UTP-ammonia lyase)
VTSLRIAVVGDFRADRETHLATSAAPSHAGATYGWDVDATWIATPDLETAAADVLAAFDGVWIAPGSPYRSLQGALTAIRFAREGHIPLIGTCGGFQHLILEYARNVLGIADAQHAEYDPDGSRLFITPLSCSLAGRSMMMELRPGTKAASAYGTRTATERYYCSFGLNPDCLAELQAGGLVVSGIDQDGEARMVELPEHPFFLATLFVPQVSSSAGSPHPLVAAFVKVAAAHRART